MIVSHKHKFIYLKTRKTASTSIEIALSKFCGPSDIITPITSQDEITRQAMGYRGPQNYIDLKLYHHSTAEYIIKRIGVDVWNSYFKFCFERNPFDKAISRYFWSTEEPRPDINQYLQTVETKLISNWPIYTINDQIVVNYIGRYENLANDLSVLMKKLHLPGELILPRAKTGHRKDKKHYSQVLNSQARRRIELVCSKEIITFGYRWQDLSDTTVPEMETLSC